MNALNTLGNFPETKKEIKSFVESAILEVQDGTYNPLETIIRLEALKKTIEGVQKGIRDMATDEAEKYGKQFDFGNAKCQVKMSGVKYDYSNCGDPIYQSMQNELNDLKNRMKARENWLKSIQGQETHLDEETGELITIYAPIKSGKETVSITLK